MVVRRKIERAIKIKEDMEELLSQYPLGSNRGQIFYQRQALITNKFKRVIEDLKTVGSHIVTIYHIELNTRTLTLAFTEEFNQQDIIDIILLNTGERVKNIEVSLKISTGYIS